MKQVLKLGDDPNTPRKCKECNRVLPISMFPLNGFKYYESICLDCKKQKQRDKYQKDKMNQTDTYWKKRLTSLKQNAEQRGLSFNLTTDDLKECYNRQNGLCWYTGKPLKKYSLDRIDSERGYSLDNIIMCELYINVFRGKMSRNDFIDLCKTISDHCSLREKEQNRGDEEK